MKLNMHLKRTGYQQYKWPATDLIEMWYTATFSVVTKHVKFKCFMRKELNFELCFGLEVLKKVCLSIKVAAVKVSSTRKKLTHRLKKLCWYLMFNIVH